MITFFVPGLPRPGGSKKAFMPKGAKHPVIVDAGGKTTSTWKSRVSLAAAEAMDGIPLLEGPVNVDVTFLFPRPKSHYGRGRNQTVLRATAPRYHTQKPDTTKVWRSTEDALSGIVWRDDVQVVAQLIRKEWADPNDKPGAIIIIYDGGGVTLGTSASTRRKTREDRLRAQGFEDPSDEQRREQLAKNVALKDWPK